MRAKSVTVADACRMIAERTGDQQAAHILRQAGDELDRLTADLAKHQPEERVGECFCGWCHCYGRGMWDHMVGVQLRENLPRHCAKFCGNCGAHLGADGIARRNQDTGLLNALERMVLGSAEHGEQVELDARHEGHGVLLVTWHTWTENFGSGEHTGPDLRAAIRAALDQEVGDGE